MVKIKLNGAEINAVEGMTILDAAKANGVYIPTLCAYEGLKPKAACRLCAVVADGEERLACATKIKDGMEIITDSDELFNKRKAIVTEMFRQHKVDCHHCMRIGSTKAKDFDPSFCRDCYFCDCVRDGFCELQAKALEFKIDELPFEIHEHDFELDDSTGSIVRDPNKCIKCRRCTDICKAQGVGILGMVKTEKGQYVGSKSNMLADGCVRCGRCVTVCPTGALYMKEHKDEEIYFAHKYETKTAALLCACVIPELTKLFGAEKGSISLEQLVDGLKKIGIDEVYDPAAVMHIAGHRASDALDKMLGKGTVIITRDYAAKSFLTKYYPELKDSFLFYDSPQQIFSEIMREKCPDAKLYSINNCNSFGAEAYETGNADYFINPRELFRIFLRTGVNPVMRKGMEPDKLCDYERCDRYSELFHAGGWRPDGEAEELCFTENGREIRALICHNLGQFKKMADKLDGYDVVKLVG